MYYSKNILDEKVSYLDKAWGPIAGELSIGECLDKIKSGYYSSSINILRDYLSNGEKEKYDNNKKRLAGVCFCGTFDQHRRRDCLKKYNYLIVIDIDKLSGGEMQRVKACFTADEYVNSFWVSPSGNGLKGLVALKFEFDISKLDLNDCHKAAFQKLTIYFKEQYEVELDASGSDTTRLCFFLQTQKYI